MCGQFPLRAEIPSGFGFESVNVSITAVGGDQSACAVIDADDAVINEGVVSGEFDSEVVVLVTGSDFSGDVGFWVDVW